MYALRKSRQLKKKKTLSENTDAMKRFGLRNVSKKKGNDGAMSGGPRSRCMAVLNLH